MPPNQKKLDHYKNIFTQVDTNQDNRICLSELKTFLKSKGHTKDLPVEKIKYIFKLADEDGARSLDFDQFVDVIEHPDLKHLVGHYMNSYVNFLVPRPKPKPVVRKIVPRGRSVRIRREDKDVALTPLGFHRRSSQAEVSVLIQEEDEISYIEEYSCCPPPLAMVLISLLELAFFLTDEIIEKDSTLRGAGVTGLVFIYDPRLRYQAWRFVTYMFVHVGRLHIVVNLIVQLALGIPLEMVHKCWRVSLLYLAGVIAGSLATSITDPYVRLAGASGGVYSLLTAHIATTIMNWSEMKYPWAQMCFFGFIICYDMGTSIYDRYNSPVDNHIGYVAHLGGAVAGLLVGIYLLKNLNVRTSEKYLWWAALTTYVILMLTGIFINVFWTSRFPPSAS